MIRRNPGAALSGSESDLCGAAGMRRDVTDGAARTHRFHDRPLAICPDWIHGWHRDSAADPNR